MSDLKNLFDCNHEYYVCTVCILAWGEFTFLHVKSHLNDSILREQLSLQRECRISHKVSIFIVLGLGCSSYITPPPIHVCIYVYNVRQDTYGETAIKSYCEAFIFLTTGVFLWCKRRSMGGWMREGEWMRILSWKVYPTK